MYDTVILQKKSNIKEEMNQINDITEYSIEDKNNVTPLETLKKNLEVSSKLVEDIILKKYLYKLNDLEIIPLDSDLKRISEIRLFKITEMVYQKDEYSTYKFASVFSAVQNLNCGVFILVDSDGEKTDFYMGVRSLDNKRTTKSLKNTLRNALVGQFPGVKTLDLLDPQAEAFLGDISSKNISSVSCVANNKDDDFKDNETYIQGLEKFVLAMQGQKYTAIVLAKSVPTNFLDDLRHSYETIYTHLSPFANMQLSYGKNEALTVSDAYSRGLSKGETFSKTYGKSNSETTSKSFTDSHSTSRVSMAGNVLKTIGSTALGIASVATAPLTGGASLVAAGVIMAGQVALNAYTPPTETEGESSTYGKSDTNSTSSSESYSEQKSITENKTKSSGKTVGTTDNMQLSMQNKTLINTLERIDLQLKRLDECESLGMWECAAYFLSDSQETAEMAAGTYKALMKGAKSGIETSAINYWGRSNTEKLRLLREYITNFIHPVFAYKNDGNYVPVSAASLLSSNELAIQMGLPRKSVCGFPVIEHAEFGKEVITYRKKRISKELKIGKVFSMGTETPTDVALDVNSLTMHTFVTGSTGSGKSNTVYEMLNQLHSFNNIPFLVVEPAKGEYKNVFGHFNDVNVYGTNPKKTKLLKINPFSFPSDIHVLEHLDRLVEIFNVCWPMYAAMPAILKDAIERAYVDAGWNLMLSENSKGKKYPTFTDILEKIELVINESKYSSDSKGDYSGALLTRVRSLTTGLNRLIFCSDELSNEELFDHSVIVDLSRVGSMETKSLIMGLIVMKLNEYRMSSEKVNSSLSHVTVLEEAHNLLKRTSTEQSADSSNLLGKSVEMLANSIAEMRTYGEGFIIADQSPGLLDMSIIRNTNTKIILRLPDRGDRELVGYASGLKEDQIEELIKLKRGVAAVYQNDWIEPVLVQINKCNVEEKKYHNLENTIFDYDDIQRQLASFLVQGRVVKKLDFSIEEVEKYYKYMGYSSSNLEIVERLITEYKQTKSHALWRNNNFKELSKLLVDVLGLRQTIENDVLQSASYNDLTNNLEKLILSILPDATPGMLKEISHCFMKDYSLTITQNEVRNKFYRDWMTYIRGR